ncbi:hypothetical protein BEH94_06715 [Candidatus Altiarchaeales archaeon WOR_SM1_SCG]|nr:hypothetical protein BEH94_06715 [Candidatus Altiarchaeales archaeon WOR_SM1_SCG]
MNNEKKILVIAFKFPPYSGIGAKRWAKFSKYFAKKGYIIHVITVKWDQLGGKNWLDDVYHSNIIIHRIPSPFIHNIKYKSIIGYKKAIKHKNDQNKKIYEIGNIKNIFKKEIYKLMRWMGDFFFYVDEAQYWHHFLIPYCKKIIKKEKIKNVIATGAPFMANYWASRLKDEMSNINIIQDFRDPWMDNPFQYFITERSKKKALEFEKKTLSNFDALVTVTNGLKDILAKKAKSKNVIKVIPNGYDLDDFKDIENKKIKRKFEFIYAGGHMLGREEPLDAFLSSVLSISKEIPELKVNFYGHFPEDVKNKYRDLFENKILVNYPLVSYEEIQNKINESFACLQLNAKVFPYLVSAKIYEYAISKRPTLSINYGGEIETMINDHRIGISANGGDIGAINKAIFELYEIWKNDPAYQIKQEGIEIYDYDKLTDEYISLLNSLKEK